MAGNNRETIFKRKGLKASSHPQRPGRSGIDGQQQHLPKHAVSSMTAVESQRIQQHYYGSNLTKLHPSQSLVQQPSFQSQNMSSAVGCFSAPIMHGVKHYQSCAPQIHDYGIMTRHNSNRDRNSTASHPVPSQMSATMSHNSDHTYPPTKVKSTMSDKSGLHSHPVRPNTRHKTGRHNTHPKNVAHHIRSSKSNLKNNNNNNNSTQWDRRNRQPMTLLPTGSHSRTNHNHIKYNGMNNSYEQHTQNHMCEQRNDYEDPRGQIYNRNQNDETYRQGIYPEYYIEDVENHESFDYDGQDSIVCNGANGPTNYHMRSKSPTPSVITSIEIVRKKHGKLKSKQRESNDGSFSTIASNHLRNIGEPGSDLSDRTPTKKGHSRESSKTSLYDDNSRGSSKTSTNNTKYSAEQQERYTPACKKEKSPLTPLKTESDTNSTYWASIAVAVATAVIQSGGSEQSAEIAQVSILNSSKESYGNPEEALSEAATKASLAVLNNGESHKIAASVTLTCLKKGGISSDSTVLGDGNQKKAATCDISTFGLFKESLSEGSKALSSQFSNFNFFSSTSTTTESISGNNQQSINANSDKQQENQPKHLNEDNRSNQINVQREIPTRRRQRHV